MSFNIALSGIAAAQTDLNTTANNIANVATVGFKESRAEFDSVYANSLFSNVATKVGDGVAVSAVAQQFHQGSLKFTQNPLDLAITGSGFFATVDNIGDQNLSYTRAGTFKLNDESYIVDNSGNYLQAFPVNLDGTSASVSLSTTQAIQIPEVAGTPQSTSDVTLSMNLPSSDEALDPAKFNPKDPETYNNATSITIYDSLGESHILTTYYVKPENAAADTKSQWLSFATIDGEPVAPWDENLVTDTTTGEINVSYEVDTDGDGIFDGTKEASYTDENDVVHRGVLLEFDNAGAFTGTIPVELTFEPLGNTGANILGPGTDGSQTLTMTYENPTQYSSGFEVTTLEQNGLTVGRVTGIQIDETGLVEATYSNGTTDALARVAMVRFKNEQGLRQQGSDWEATQNSGAPIAGEASAGSFGSIRSAALEQSNVDLTNELVDLITSQRNFQANSRALETNNTLQQTILQIR
jgi:flagellar hook protein FlgE